MKPLSSFGYVHLTMLAKPACDRAIYKLIRKHKFRSIIEVGMETGTRSVNMIQVAKKFGVSPNVRYTGVDLFEARESEQGKLQLIEMHRTLKSLDAKTQLVPGDVRSAVARIANSHVRTDLIVISAGFDAGGARIQLVLFSANAAFRLGRVSSKRHWHGGSKA